MPCQDWGRSSCEGHQEKIDKLTRMLCSICTMAESWHGAWIEFDPELSKWWSEHKRKDAERLKHEKQEKKKKEQTKLGLSKLSKKEKELLDIRDEDYL